MKPWGFFFALATVAFVTATVSYFREGSGLVVELLLACFCIGVAIYARLVRDD